MLAGLASGESDAAVAFIRRYQRRVYGLAMTILSDSSAAEDVAQETFARGVRWLKAERLNFPRRETIVEAFRGFESEIVPLWGRTPFNNYLFVFKRASSGMTNE